MDRRVARGLLIAMLAVIGGCSGDPVIIDPSEDPFLYLVLGERTHDRRWLGNVGQHALLLTAGSPAEPVAYRSAERFEMRRVSDGASFAWEALPASGEVGSFPDARLDAPSHYLPDSPAGGSLGAADLVPGGTYKVEIKTLGVTITGRVRMPDQIQLGSVQDEGRRLVTWRAVNGAGGYRVLRGDGVVALQTDTLHVIPEDVRAGGWIEVQALSPELYAYMEDPRATRAGIDQGYGIFGAITSARLAL